MKKSRRSRKEKDQNDDFIGTKTDTQIRKTLISKLLGDGGHRFNRLMQKLEEADDEGYGYIDKETFLEIFFIHLRTRHRPNEEESNWLVEQLQVRNKRMNLIAYKEFRKLITGDHIDVSPNRNVIRKYTVPSFIQRSNYPYPYPDTIYDNTTGSVALISDLGMTETTTTNNRIIKSASPFPYQSIMNQSTPMNRYRNVELSDDEEEDHGIAKENSKPHTPKLKNNQNTQWATGSVGEWLAYQATPMERMNLEELLEMIENYIVDKGLNNGTQDCPAGIGRPTQDGISLKIGPSLEVKLSFHTTS